MRTDETTAIDNPFISGLIGVSFGALARAFLIVGEAVAPPQLLGVYVVGRTKS